MDGMPKQEAARLTAQKVKVWGAFNADSITATTVINWRDDVKAKLASVLDLLMRRLLKSGERPRAAAQRLIDAGPPFGPRKT